MKRSRGRVEARFPRRAPLVFLRCVFVCVTAGALCSCDLLRDSPFAVAAWTPGSGYHPGPQQISVSLIFSGDPDMASVERNFSLAEDGVSVRGSFEWRGRMLVFHPLAPLEANRDYTIGVSPGASDYRGLSLDNAFAGVFTTRPPSSRPELISMDPGPFGILAGEWGKVRLVFSQPPSPASLRDHVSFSPSMSGIWDTEGNAAVFTPGVKWITGQRYEVRISPSFAGTTGLSLGKSITSVFTAGVDTERPFLIAARALFEDGSFQELAEEIPGNYTENSHWERTTRLVLVFSEDVDTFSVRSALSAEGASSPVSETPPGMTSEMIFSLSGTPAWGSRFLFRLGPGVRDAAGNESENTRLFRIHADGPFSKPPSLAGMRLPMAPGKGAGEQELAVYTPGDLFDDLPVQNGEGRFPYGTEVSEWIELYFDTAEGSFVDPLSVMELFRVESAGAFSFSPRSVRREDFSEAAPAPGWEEYERVEIRGVLVNSTGGGVVSFITGAGLRDSLGNLSEKVFRISLLK
ncbi:MAG: Ig-like domain-containing protein [Treponema sp.]|jgi:hypothetical protein|nr:Ig-like domain-containing protein [Treponema sp.]